MRQVRSVWWPSPRCASRAGLAWRRAFDNGTAIEVDGWVSYVGKSRLGIGPELGELQGDYLDSGAIIRWGRDNAGLTLSVTNIGTRPCKRDVGPGANELQITQGEVTIWSSDDCNPNEDKDVVTLDRGDAFETQLVWDGYLSAAGCPPDQPMAQAGEYTVVGRNGAIVSAPTALRLE